MRKTTLLIFMMVQVLFFQNCGENLHQDALSKGTEEIKREVPSPEIILSAEIGFGNIAIRYCTPDEAANAANPDCIKESYGLLKKVEVVDQGEAGTAVIAYYGRTGEIKEEILRLTEFSTQAVHKLIQSLDLDAQLVDPYEGAPICMDAGSIELKAYIDGQPKTIRGRAQCHRWDLVNDHNGQRLADLLETFVELARAAGGVRAFD